MDDRLHNLAAALGAKLKQSDQTIAIFESSSGGLISSALLAVPGASGYYQGGGVIYTLAARKALTGIDEASMRGVRSSSEPYAKLLAQAARHKFGTTWGLGETGAAGPGGNRYGDAAGHTCIAISGPIEHVITVETGHGDRERNMWEFTEAALALLEKGIDATR
jgi:PncC family amidohydrolase